MIARISSLFEAVSPRLRFGLAFSGLAVLAFASALDATLLGNALPVVAADVGATSVQAFWMSTSFLLAAVAFQPVHTAFSDVFGRKPTLYLCCVLFVVGIVIFGTGHTPAVLILGRTIQGMGGGGLEVLSEVVLTDMTTLKERPLYLGIMSFFWAGAAVAGPPVGGALAQYLTWRWLAWILLPMMGIALLLIPPFLTLAEDRTSFVYKTKRIDWAGIGLFICAATLILFPVTAGGQMLPWNSYKLLTPLLIGVVCFIAFCFVETKALEPMLPPRIMSNRTVAASMLGAFLHGTAMWCMLFYAPVFFQSVFTHEPLKAAVDGLSFGFTATPMAVLTAFMIDYLRRYRWSLWLGWLFACAGTAALTALSVDTTVIHGRALFIPAGIGLGMLYPSLAMPIQAATGATDVGVATGTLVFFRNLGSTVGVAVGSTIFSNHFAQEFDSKSLMYSDYGMADAQDAIDLIPRLKNLTLTDDLRHLLLSVYASSFVMIGIFMAVTAGVGLLSTIFVSDLTLENEEMGRQAFQTKAEKRETQGSEDLCEGGIGVTGLMLA